MWRSMETAPKDGSRFLALLHGRYHRILFWATYYSEFYRADMTGWWESQNQHWPNKDVTHWMPLPEPEPA